MDLSLVGNTTSHTAVPAKVTPSSPSPNLHTLPRRGHTRSASLENANSFNAKNTTGLPAIMVASTSAVTGTLKSRNEQKRARSKFGSHNNLDDYTGTPGRTKFQNIRQIFELNQTGKNNTINEQDVHNQMQSLPIINSSINKSTTQTQTPKLGAKRIQNQLHAAYKQQYVAQKQQQQQRQKYNEQQQQQQQVNHNSQPQQHQSISNQQHHKHQQYAHHQQQQLTRKTTPTPLNYYGNRHSIAEVNERLNITEQMEQNKNQQQPLQQNTKVQQTNNAHYHHNYHHYHQHHHNQQQPQQQKYNSLNTLNIEQELHDNAEQSMTLLRPIAFKPIPFEPDYSIPNRYCDVVMMNDHYGSTPSLAPVSGSNFRFGSTTDLRHGWSGCASAGNGVAGVGVGVGVGGHVVAGYSSNNYCNSLMARRRGGSRSLKINDSMESIRHTPDSDAHSQTSTIKSQCDGGSTSTLNNNNCDSNNNNNPNINNNKYNLSNVEQCDMTPSPSDSGISDLEAALKDRDSELSYLRQTMEHNEKVIFKVQKDKEAFWENETKRLKCFYEAQQREFVLKMRKMEQMLAMQQFQLKQHKLKSAEQTDKLREQMADLKNENEILRSHNVNLKNSERNLKDQVAYIEEQSREDQQSLSEVKQRLEESEWRVCERNGELALLKNQLKEANIEITMREHALVHLKQENTHTDVQTQKSLQNETITNQRDVDAQLEQLNKIIILKDQVILALTTELAKLRKDLSDLALTYEYGEEPSGKFARLKQQLDSLTDICNRTRTYIEKSDQLQQLPKEKVIDDTNLEVIMKCLKLAPTLDQSEQDEGERAKILISAEKRLAKMSSDIQKFVYGSQNLPDIALNVKSNKQSQQNLEESTLDTLIEESANYAGEIAKLRKQLDDVRENFELEKRQWCEEREKVLNYQKQLQSHYISMYQKMRSMKNGSDV